METTQSYIVASNKSWNKQIYQKIISNYDGNWIYIESPEELTVDALRSYKPKAIFFLHWSFKVADAITNNYTCINFHMTDLPYGRGGSPLQHLILSGHKETVVTAFQMEKQLDAGPIYLKRPLSLEGNAKDIYVRCSKIAAEMIGEIITQNIQPVPQEGNPIVFKRRNPTESEVPNKLEDLTQLYDFIRMLDAEGYPKAFINMKDGFTYEFSDAEMGDNDIKAKVSIKFSTKDQN